MLEREASLSEGYAAQSKMPWMGALCGLPSPNWAFTTAPQQLTNSSQLLVSLTPRLAHEAPVWMPQCHPLLNQPQPLARPGLLPKRRLGLKPGLALLTLLLLSALLHSVNPIEPSCRKMNSVSSLIIMLKLLNPLAGPDCCRP